MKNIINSKISALIHHLGQSEKGSVIVEFVLMFPIFMMLLFGGFEAYHFLMTQKKIDQSVNTISHLTTQAKVASLADMGNIFKSVEHIMAPYEITSDDQIIVSYIEHNNGASTITYQCYATANASYPSKLGALGDSPALTILSNDFALNNGETTIVTEFYYDFSPIFLNLSKDFGGKLFTKRIIYHNSVREPRFGNISFDPGCP